MRNFEKELTNEPNIDPAFLSAESATPLPDYQDWETLAELPDFETWRAMQAEAEAQSMDKLVPAGEAHANAQSMEGLEPSGTIKGFGTEQEQSEENNMQFGY